MTEDKTKVKDLATELGVPTKNLLQALRELDIPAKSTSSNIAAEDIDRVKNHLKDSATSEQGDRREVQPGVIVRRRRQSTEDVAAEGEEAPRAERTRPRPALSACPARPRHRPPRPSRLRNPKRLPLRKFPCRHR